jgi:hypothetical protein
MRKRWKNHISASKGLSKHPKRLATEGAWRPGKRGGKIGLRRYDKSRPRP